MAEKIPGWLERILLPRLSEISGEMKAMNARVEGLSGKIDSLRNEMLARFEAVNTSIEALEKIVNTRIEALEKRIPMIEELADLKVRLAQIEKKLITSKQG